MPIPLGILAQAGRTISSGSYELITSQILTGSQASVTFSNLGDYLSTYKHLQIRVVSRMTYASSSATGEYRMTMNGDTAGNYSWHYLLGNGSSVSSGASTSASNMWIGRVQYSNPTNGFSAMIVDILDAYSTTKNKTIRSFNGAQAASANEIALFSGNWRSTASVTSLTITPNISDLAQYSRFSLYGIKG